MPIGTRKERADPRYKEKTQPPEEQPITRHNSVPLGTRKKRAARDTISLSDMVEAGGVEPPSEKRYATEPTCLSQFVWFASRAWNEQETPPASPMISPTPYGPKGAGQLTV